MPASINRYNSFEILATLDSANIAVYDIITGATSGGAGIVLINSSVTTPETGTARAGTASTIQLKSTPANNIGAAGCVRTTGGTGSGQIRQIVSWNNTTRTATVSPNWGTNPDATTTYSVEDRLTVASISGNFTAGGEAVTNQDTDSCTITQTGTGADVPGNTYRPDNVVILTGVNDVDSTANLNEDLDDTETGVDTTDGTQFSEYNIIRIEDEDMLVLSISTNTVTVVRGYNGTTATTHSSGLNIYKYYKDGFRQIRNASNSGGWSLHTDPSATSHILLLNCWLFYGRRDQTERTSFISEKENVNTRSGNTFNYITAVDNTTYKTYVRYGDAIYKSNSEANFPPRQTCNGIIIDSITNGFYDYSELRMYDSCLYNAGTAYATGQLLMQSKCLISRLNSYKIDYVGFSNTQESYIDDSLFQSSSLLSTGKITFSKTAFFTALSDWSIFINADSSEAPLEDTEIFDVAETIAGNFGVLFSTTLKHFINCTFYNTMPFVLAASGIFFDEKTFDLKVTDTLNNVISGATVKLLGNTKYSALYVDSGVTLAVAMTNAQTTMNVSDYTLLSAGKVYRIDAEKVLVTDASANPVTVTRAQEGTTATAHIATRTLWEREESILTDSNGDISQHIIVAAQNINGTYTNYNPFKLIVSKAGYKTLKMPLRFGGGTTLSYKTDFVKEIAKLEKYRFREERSF